MKYEVCLFSDRNFELLDSDSIEAENEKKAAEIYIQKHDLVPFHQYRCYEEGTEWHAYSDGNDTFYLRIVLDKA